MNSSILWDKLQLPGKKKKSIFAVEKTNKLPFNRKKPETGIKSKDISHNWGDEGVWRVRTHF